MESFAVNLRRYRVRAGLTQEELAQTVGLSSRYVTRLESGKVNVTIGVLALLAEAVGAPIRVALHELQTVLEQLAHPRGLREPAAHHALGRARFDPESVHPLTGDRDALDEAASFAAALDPEDPDARRLTVYADQRAPFGVVASVLHTAARAGLQPWSLAVERAPFDVGVIEASPWTEGGARQLVDIDARGAVTRSGDPGAPVVEIQAAGEARFGRWVEVAISERAACEATRGCPRLAIALAPR